MCFFFSPPVENTTLQRGVYSHTSVCRGKNYMYFHNGVACRAPSLRWCEAKCWREEEGARSRVVSRDCMSAEVPTNGKKRHSFFNCDALSVTPPKPNWRSPTHFVEIEKLGIYIHIYYMHLPRCFSALSTTNFLRDYVWFAFSRVFSSKYYESGQIHAQYRWSIQHKQCTCHKHWLELYLRSRFL